MKNILYLLSIILLLTSCNKDNPEAITHDISIIFINDQHGQIDNFARLKHLIDEEEKTREVIVACAGDMFSGNPVVDIWEKKGYPMIDLMNKTGFDISVIGNHEFDYGQIALANRMEQANFEWVCANVDMQDSGIAQPKAFTTIQIDDLRICFLGLVETNGKEDQDIPSTHPSKLEGIAFERPENICGQFAELKTEENADLLIALTHLGHNNQNGKLGDFQLAQEFPYFDLIIGGHSNPVLDTIVNGIPIFQAGKYLNFAGKISISIMDREVQHIQFEAIDLNNYPDFNEEIQADVDYYNQSMGSVLSEVIAFSARDHNREQLGCFYTDALRERMEVDVSFQNYGGIRNGLAPGEVTVGDIYAIDPFNNGALIYHMTGYEIKEFLKANGSWIAYSGIEIDQDGQDILLWDIEGNEISDETLLSIGINDYIPAVNDSYFPLESNRQSYTTAEALIYYLKNINSTVDYEDCPRYFRYE